MSFLLIDGDQYLYKGTAAVEREIRWDDENHVLYSNAEEAYDTVRASLDSLFDRFETYDHIVCFSGPNNFRYKISDEYKGSRKGHRKPLCYAAVKERVGQSYKTKEVPKLEADDLLGIYATDPRPLFGESGTEYPPNKRIIVSQDKDLKTIPGVIWDGSKKTIITEARADWWFCYQVLVGDNVDGYKGCPGVGPKKAESILSDCDTIRVAWPRIVKAYEDAGLTKEDAITQARMARILRYGEYNFETEAVNLWKP